MAVFGSVKTETTEQMEVEVQAVGEEAEAEAKAASLLTTVPGTAEEAVVLEAAEAQPAEEA